MERRKVIKQLTGLAALAFLPKQHLYEIQQKQKKPIHIVGLGSAGTTVMKHFKNLGLGDKYTAITDNKSELPEGVHHFSYSHRLTKRDRVFEEIFQSDSVEPFVFPKETMTIFSSEHRFVLIAGLGGYTSTHMCREIVTFLQDSKIDYKAVFSLPFEFEGSKIRDFAKEMVTLFEELPQVQFFDNEMIIEKYGNLDIKAAYKKADEALLNIYKINKWV